MMFHWSEANSGFINMTNMKNFLILVVVIFHVTLLNAQGQGRKHKENRNFRIPLIGETAPSFIAESTGGTINFPGDFGGKWKVLFSHPQDFTPVCTTEIIELAHLQNQFDHLGVQLVVISVGSVDTHIQWIESMEKLNLNNEGYVKIRFPLVDDKNLFVSKLYGMVHSESNTTNSVRGVFIIDPHDIIQAIIFYPVSTGRSIDELFRIITALQATASENVMTPANWKSGDDFLVPVPPKIDANILPAGYYSPVWYMLYKKAMR